MTAKKVFMEYARENIKREGIEDLLDWLENDTDFFTSPASTKYHGSFEGGLLEHSLNVFEQLLVEFDTVVGKGWESVYSPESVAIAALFHDLCKVNSYTTEQRWRKDAEGKWEAYYPYVYNSEKRAMGHGAQSVYFIQQFITLTEDEAEAIFWHMGAYDISPYANLNGLSKTWQNNALAYMLSRADMAATYVLENDKFIFPEEGNDVEEVLDDSVEEVEEVEEEIVEKEEPVKEEKPKAKPPVKPKPGIRKPKPLKEEPEVVEEVEEVIESKVAAKASYFINLDTMEPVKVLKGESIDFLDEGSYKELMLKEYKQSVIEWEQAKEKETVDSENTSDVDTYWYDPRTREYYIVKAGTEFSKEELNGVNEELTKEEYEQELEDLEAIEDDEEVAAVEDETEEAEEVEEGLFVDGLSTEISYWYDNDDETFFSLPEGSEHPGEQCDQVDKEEYDEAFEDEPTVFGEDTYVLDPNKKPQFFKAGEDFPGDYWKGGWQTLTESEYNKLTAPKPAAKKEEKPKAVAKARRTPAPSRRPRP